MLYHKSSFAVRHATSKDPNRPNLHGIYFDEDGSTVALNGHFLLRVKPKIKTSSVEFYKVLGIDSNLKLKPFIISREDIDRIVNSFIKKISKVFQSFKTISLNVEVTNTGKTAQLIMDHPEGEQIFKINKMEMDFPKFKNVFPKRKEYVHSLTFNARYLETILKAAREFGLPDKHEIKIEFTDDVHNPVHLVVENKENGEFEALLMPIA